MALELSTKPPFSIGLCSRVNNLFPNFHNEPCHLPLFLESSGGGGILYLENIYFRNRRTLHFEENQYSN